MEKGTLVEFRLQGDGAAEGSIADRIRQRRLAVLDRPEGKKHWVAIDGRSQPHVLHPRQITYQVAGETYKPADIAKFVEEIEPYLDPSSLEVAWELLSEDGETTDPAGLAEILFSDTRAPLCYAAYCLLSEDKLYFKQKGDRYEPRSRAQIAEIQHQQQVAAAKQEEWQQYLQRIEQALAGKSVEWQEGDRPRLEAIERFATFAEEATHRTPALETLAALKRPETPEAAFQLLVDLSLWSPHENLYLRRTQLPTTFSSRVIDMAHRCLQTPPPDPDANRLDLTHLKVYTIDDESTKEIDDGLSLETLPDGIHRLWIHIADPTRYVLPGDELDLEARRRCTTVYLPTGMIPMFPPELATGPMSLVQGRLCTALSFGVILDESGAISDFEIHASLIKPTYRLTYEDVDEMLGLGVQAEAELETIAHFSKLRHQWRHQQGAITIHMPESSIKVRNDEITIDVLDDSIARRLVAEMMILAGETAGRYGQEQGLPLPYRGQAQPELPPEEELMLLPSGPVRASAIRRCMPRSEMNITPVRHASLGLDTYTQVTSPIRRYTDLLSHFQIKAHLRGDDLPFDGETLKELVQAVSSTAYESVLVERQTNRYWGLEYLRRNSDEVWNGLLLRWLREHENLGLVLLEDLAIELAMRFTRSINVGDRLELKVTFVDPRQDVVQFSECKPEIQPAAS